MIKNNNVILATGLLSLVVAIVLHIYAPQAPVANFFQGFCCGLSLVMNAFYMIRQRNVMMLNKEKKQ